MLRWELQHKYCHMGDGCTKCLRLTSQVIPYIERMDVCSLLISSIRGSLEYCSSRLLLAKKMSSIPR